jgi:V/A-type H+-transporting ATPase subunit C
MADAIDTRIARAVRSGYKRVREKVPIETGNYPYVTARLKAKRALLIPDEMYAKMLQMEIPQIARVLGEGEYKQELLHLGARLSGVDLIEAATAENLARVFTQIIGFSEGHLKFMISKYLGRWDVRNVKTILRGKLYGASTSEIIDDLVPAGSLGREFLSELAAMDSVGMIFRALEGTMFEKALASTGKQPSELANLAEYEDALSQEYYQTLLDAIPPSTFGSKLFRRFVQQEIDFLNLKTLLRLWAQKVRLDREVFLDGGLDLNRDDLDAMLELKKPALISRLSEYYFYDEVVDDLKSFPEAGVSHLSRRLEKFHMVHAAENAHMYPLTIVPVLEYIVSKQREVQNVRIIARGKQSGLSTDVIKELLVI